MTPQDRIRLRRNPKNVAVPAGFDDFYNEDGNLIRESPGGVKETIGAGGSATVPATWSKLVNEGAAVVVDSQGSDTDRGTALLAAYVAAKALTPNGSALSASNRSVVILPPGKYKIAETLDLDANYVDFLALFPQSGGDIRVTDQYGILESGGTSLTYYRPPPTVIYRDDNTQSAVVRQTCADIRLEGFGIAYLGDPSAWAVSNGIPIGAFLIADVNNSASQYTQMYFWSKASFYEDAGAVRAYWSFRGIWRNCIASSCSFRVGYGDLSSFPAEITFEAIMENCQAGPYSFIGDGYPGQNYTAKNSTLTNCKTLGVAPEQNSDPLTTESGFAGFAGCTAIGVALQSTVKFIECESGPNSFCVGNTNAATHIRCRAGKNSFGGTNAAAGAYAPGTFSGYAEDCYSGANSFGGTSDAGYGKCTGTLVRCIGIGNSVSTRLEGATIRDSRFTVTTTGIHAFTLIDSNCTISNSDIIVIQGGTGVPIYAATAKNVGAYNCRMNNASNDADGLHANVTNLVSSAGNVISNSVK